MIRNEAVRVQMVGGSLVAMLLFVLAAGFAPRVSAAEQDLRKCMDGAWSDYNECLVEESTRFGKKLCDIFFQAEVVLCGAKYVGEVKDAANGSGES